MRFITASQTFFIMAFWLAAGFAMPAEACRYNVRDVGFVDFGSEPYRMYAFVDSQTGDTETSTLKRTSFAAFLDANVEGNVIDIEASVDKAALRVYESLGKPPCPALALVHPNGGAIPIEMPNAGNFKDDVWTAMAGLTQSAMRDEIMDQCIEHYGVVFMAEGSDPQENERINAICRKAIERIAGSMDNLPKEVKNPPTLIALPYQERGDESLMLWSLGIDAAAPDAAVAVMYGRGRRLGDAMIGKQAAFNDVLGILGVIGLSCECGLDRKWMMGTMMPSQWDEERQAKAAKAVGFDTENPMVKTEISQIISKGMSAKSPADALDSAASDPLLGYEELTVHVIEGSQNEIKTQEASQRHANQAQSSNPIERGLQAISETSASSGDNPTDTPVLTFELDQNPIVEPEHKISTRDDAEQERVAKQAAGMAHDIALADSPLAIAMETGGHGEESAYPKSAATQSREFQSPENLATFLLFCIGVMAALCGLSILFIISQSARNPE